MNTNQQKIERLEKALLTIIHLNRLFSKRADELEKRIQEMEDKQDPPTEGKASG